MESRMFICGGGADGAMFARRLLDSGARRPDHDGRSREERGATSIGLGQWPMCLIA